MLAIACALLMAGSAAPVAPVHSVEYWRAIAKADYAPPAGADVPALTIELLDMLGSPDPELRDQLAYSALASWIYERKLLDIAALQAVTATLLGNLRINLGSVGTDAVLGRSFSALILSVVVARDNADPVLDESGYQRILTATLAYLDAEKDTRGYDEAKGWMHSAAHTADLLKFLARSRYATTADQAKILDAITRKLNASSVLIYGEDERLARAVLAIVNRKDFDTTAFTQWTQKSRPAAIRSERPSAAQLQAAQNVKNMFSKLDVLLSADDKPTDSVKIARESVQAVLKNLY
jgi:Protein of unknown function (DUF2785)